MVHWMMEDDADSVWLYLACGLVRIARAEFDAWASDPKQQIRPTVFDSSDGVRNLGLQFGYSSVVAKSSDGRLWFLPFGGVSVIDPHRLAFNKLPPPVHIEQIAADGKTYAATNGLRLPPRVRDLEIDYTALSLVAPEKVRFRIKLEGQDQDWRELINVRHVRYTNLPPGIIAFASSRATTAECGTKKAHRWSSGSRLRGSRRPGSARSACSRARHCCGGCIGCVSGSCRHGKSFREAVESMPALAFVRADGSRVFVNRRWVEYHRTVGGAGDGRSGWQAAVHPDDRRDSSG